MMKISKRKTLVFASFCIVALCAVVIKSQTNLIERLIQTNELFINNVTSIEAQTVLSSTEVNASEAKMQPTAACNMTISSYDGTTGAQGGTFTFTATYSPYEHGCPAFANGGGNCNPVSSTPEPQHGQPGSYSVTYACTSNETHADVVNFMQFANQSVRITQPPSKTTKPPKPRFLIRTKAAVMGVRG